MNDLERAREPPEAGDARSEIHYEPSAMGCANVPTLAAAIIWLGVFLGAADHYRQLPQYGYSGEWDIWVYFPMGAAVGLLLSLLIFNFLIRSAAALIVLSAIALLALLPYLFMTSGGV